MAPIPNLEASLSITNGFEKSGVARTRVEDIICFNVSNHFLASPSHRKEFLFRRFVSGVVTCA